MNVFRNYLHVHKLHVYTWTKTNEYTCICTWGTLTRNSSFHCFFPFPFISTKPDQTIRLTVSVYFISFLQSQHSKLDGNQPFFQSSLSRPMCLLATSLPWMRLAMKFWVDNFGDTFPMVFRFNALFTSCTILSGIFIGPLKVHPSENAHQKTLEVPRDAHS